MIVPFLRKMTTAGMSMLSAFLLAIGLCAMVSPQASASEYTRFPAPMNVCGSGYGYVGSYWITVPGLGDFKYGKVGTKVGVVEVYWNRNAMKNCAIARAYGPTINIYMGRFIDIGTHYGPATNGSQQIEDVDAGRFKSYAGPVYTSKQKAHNCIDLAAGFYPPDVSAYYGYFKALGVHCG